MCRQSAIITGANGFIGTYISTALADIYNLHLVDINDVDLGCEREVQNYMMGNKSPILVNLFAINQHISNAKDGSVTASQPPSLSDYLDINVRALHDVCMHFINTRPEGVIMNLSSLYGIVSPNPSIYPKGQAKDIGYSVSKTAVNGLSSC